MNLVGQAPPEISQSNPVIRGNVAFCSVCRRTAINAKGPAG